MDELSSNYATALFSLVGKEEAPRYLPKLEEFASLLHENDLLNRALCSYSLGKKEKEGLLESALGKERLPHLLDFLKVVLSHHRMRHLDAIIASYRSLVNESIGVKEGICYTPFPLEKAKLQQIEKAFEKRLNSKVHLINRVDENILGGVKVALDGKVYDGSLRSRLQELGKNLK